MQTVAKLHFETQPTQNLARNHARCHTPMPALFTIKGQTNCQWALVPGVVWLYHALNQINHELSELRFLVNELVDDLFMMTVMVVPIPYSSLGWIAKIQTLDDFETIGWIQLLQ